MLKQWLKRLDQLATWKIVCIFAFVGIAFFATGLGNPFQGDDTYQVVHNTPVHSLSSIPELFQHSTFFNGERLVGIYYRPLMSTTFALIYAFFGANPVPYHIVQLGFYIASAILLFLFLRVVIKKMLLALLLALFFLVHPLNSQIVYSIPTMQDALFFFFGILALYILVVRKSVRSLVVAAACIFLAMLSKESGVAFAMMACLYLLLFDRQRLRSFIVIMALPIALYLTLKIHAVGLVGSQHAAPIDEASLVTRLLTAPSIMFFYLTKFLFPAQLATGYYWVNKTFDVQTVLLPLLADLAAIGMAGFGGWRVRAKMPDYWSKLYWFFFAWTALGIVLYLQVIKLDMTACETWFYFAMAGLLGMIGVGVQSTKLHIRPEWAASACIILIAALGVRTAIRGTDYQSQYKLALQDVAVSNENYSALSNISQYQIDHGNYAAAVAYARRSIAIYPVVSNYINLGVALQQSGDYPGAISAYNAALKYGDLAIIYENLGLIYVVYGEPAAAQQYFSHALSRYPHDFKLWIYLAVFEGSRGSQSTAKQAVEIAAQYGIVPQPIANAILGEQPLPLQLLGQTVLVH